jgi:hypothetical protein
MRTVKLIWSTKPDAMTTVQLETEVVVDDEADARTAGEQAVHFLADFQQGVIEGAQGA